MEGTIAQETTGLLKLSHIRYIHKLILSQMFFFIIIGGRRQY